ncbi:PepSY domain-containing protein [Phaeobacter gallaeciensis]|uniref:PepSY domain-containing protein n=2 Tax=Roseobacteraceae TaxID=2854170 RepID=A0A366XF20_9RHOB|nr:MULTISPECIES: PepSY domain-containing protein [Roseobacteraceae]MBT3143933.1 PepSY domain-containing protein [Falsiruegeria litorea]MBT8168962.1 PepSY domain-containing protein [Falsiruegeria litorea]RBW62628.1 PepSY domain-containing protein [Phaeobacter gallaeciensis]
MAMDSQHVAADASQSDFAQKFYFAAWRWHFYAGLFVIPFLIILAVTGLMMMLLTQVDGRDGEKIAVAIQGEPLAVSAQADVALDEVPGTVVEWIGPKAADLATVFRIKTETGQRMVAIDPYAGDVLLTWDRRAGWYDLADNIHSTLLIGNTGDRLLEIAAGLSLVLVFTGLYMWWPRGNGVSAFVPNLRARGRALWKSLHAVVGFWMSGLLVLFLVSGLSWAGVWGGMIVQPWSSFPAEKWDNVPLSDDIHASMNHGSQNDVPWALEQTPMPASGSDAGITGIPKGTKADINSMVALGSALGMNGRFRVAYPSSDTGVWTLNRDSMSSDSTDPVNDRTVHVDQFTGNILADVRYADYSVMGKAMALGIPLHMGLMGLWNFILNTVFCLSVIFVCVSGVVMWLKRRPSQAGRLAAPPLPAELPFWKGAVMIGLFTSMAFPLVGLTLLSVLAFDLLILSNIPAMKRAFS